MARLPISRSRRTNAQVALLTARKTVKAAPKVVARTPRALKLRFTAVAGRRLVPIGAAIAALGSLLMVRKRRRKRQDDGLGLYEPPPAATRRRARRRQPAAGPGRAPAAGGAGRHAGGRRGQ
ncbi:MAG TPA: hypothetical protein VFT42_03795, partial [Solirubrobacteraceae bacterium]|nr:hypothetical protein [Solirubrobacteraceae bacterium]